jgi:hypothetical protein
VVAPVGAELERALRLEEAILPLQSEAARNFDGNVPATDGGALPPSRRVVRSTIVSVRIVRVRIEAVEGPVAVLKPPMALELLVAASELAPVPTIPCQSGYGLRCHCQDHDS